MIKKIVCDCGHINIVNVNQKVIHNVTEPERVFGYIGEKLEVMEIEVDTKYCKGCGKKLSVT